MMGRMAEPPPPAPALVILGDRRHPLSDLYHALLVRPWGVTLGAIAALVLALNLVFAVAYWAVGGVANAAGFADCFFFSVQTSGTIGYGGMTPTSTAANALVVVESVLSLLATALATGVVFAKYSRPTARIRFAARPTISRFEGKPTLRLRIGNLRGNNIVDATVRVVFSRTHTTIEGEQFYPQVDLQLVRAQAPALSRAWVVMHVIDAHSPLHGLDAAALAAAEAELFVSVTGLDETTMQTVHARTGFDAAAIAWGMRPDDVVSTRADGTFVIDLHRFDALVPAA